VGVERMARGCGSGDRMVADGSDSITMKGKARAAPSFFYLN
jgi:hypothetical protein